MPRYGGARPIRLVGAGDRTNEDIPMLSPGEKAFRRALHIVIALLLAVTAVAIGVSRFTDDAHHSADHVHSH